MNWFKATVALLLAVTGLVELIAPRKVIDFSVWFMRNWYFIKPTKDWYLANSPLMIRILGIFSVLLALILLLVVFKSS